jgi:predicted ATP-dependent Lon-type protease
VLVALCSALLGKPLKGGLIIVGGINLGGSIEPVHNPIDVVELALEKGATTVMMPVSCRRLLVIFQMMSQQKSRLYSMPILLTRFAKLCTIEQSSYGSSYG